MKKLIRAAAWWITGYDFRSEDEQNYERKEYLEYVKAEAINLAWESGGEGWWW